MAENGKKLMLEPLKRFQATLECVKTRIEELRVRQTETHTAVLSLRRDQLNNAEVTAHMQSQMAKFGDRLDRVERRLDLTN